MPIERERKFLVVGDTWRSCVTETVSTDVDGEFEGCDFDKRIPLQNGMVFVCSEYNYSYGYMPEVLILRHVSTGDIKVLIDEEEFEGTVFRRN